MISSTVGTTGFKACGETVSLLRKQVFMKQELLLKQSSFMWKPVVAKILANWDKTQQKFDREAKRATRK